MIETLALVPWESVALHLRYVFLSYLLGSIPFGLIFGWLAGAGDIRKIGSGNIGATNVLRTGKTLGRRGDAVLRCGQRAISRCDMPANISAFNSFRRGRTRRLYRPSLSDLARLQRGGKGVATFIGIVFALAWPVAAPGLRQLARDRATRFGYSSLAALIATALTPIYFLFAEPALFALLTFILAVLIFVAHPRQYHPPVGWQRTADRGAMMQARVLRDDERRAWLRLARTETIGPATFAALIARFPDVREALDAAPRLARRGGRARVAHAERGRGGVREIDALAASGRPVHRLVPNPIFPAASPRSNRRRR